MRRDDELDKELQFHIDERVADLVQSGVTPEEASRRARLELGGVMQVKEAVRDQHTWPFVGGMSQDFRIAVRALRATPLVTLVAVLSLTLGIGANTAIFSLVNGVLLRTLPVRDPDRLVFVSDTATTAVQYFDYAVWDQIRNRPQLFDAVGAWIPTRLNLAAGGETQFVDGAWVSGSYFDTLGVGAVVGRVLSAADDRRGGTGSGPVMLISYGLWQRRFGGTPDVVGRQLSLNGMPVSIIGVTPRGFFGIDVGRTSDVMLPFGDEPLVNGRDSSMNAGLMGVTLVGRLKAGQTPELATAALRAVQPEIRELAFPASGTRRDRDPFLRDYLKNPFTLVPAATGNSNFLRRYVRPLVTLMCAAALVLLMACANIANVVLARATARRHELSVRVALGAARWRLVRQLLAESILLAGISATSGILVASWVSRLLVQQLSTETAPVFLDLSPDWRMLAFTVVVAVTTVALFGVVPAVRASSVAPLDALKAHGRGPAGEPRVGFPSALVVAQVALSVVLVVAAGLFVRTFVSLMSRDPGFARDDILVVRIDSQRAIVDPGQRIALYERVRAAVRGVPGVADAALAQMPLLGNIVFDPPIDVSGTGPRTLRESRVYGNVISPGWFATFGVPLVAGRDLTDADRPGAPPVAIVNQAFARKFLNGASPLDHTITLPELMTRPAANVPVRIVGVVADSVYVSLRESPQATMYLPLGQRNEPAFVRALSSINLNVRSIRGSPPQLAKSVAAAIGNVNPHLALTIRPLVDQVGDSLARERVVAMLAAFFGLLAVLLAGLGLYGVTAYAVSRRRSEIGIRIALGAAPASVVRLVLSRVSMLVGFGVVLGALVSLAATKLVASLLYGLEARDPATLVGAAATLATVGLFAGWVPARRACRIDPAEALRQN